MELIVETNVPSGEPSSAHLPVRPLPGQGVGPTLDVECSSSIRQQHPAGLLFLLPAKLTACEDTPFLYVHHAAPVEHMIPEGAWRFISTMFYS